MMQRTASESAASTSSSKMSRRLGFALRKIGIDPGMLSNAAGHA